jgi:hypothetical protein
MVGCEDIWLLRYRVMFIQEYTIKEEMGTR